MAFSLRETGETVTALSLTLIVNWRLTGIGIGIEQRFSLDFLTQCDARGRLVLLSGSDG